MDDAVRICSHGGGSKNLDAFITQTQALINQGMNWQALGITMDDAVRILSRSGGAIKLQKIFQYSPLLFALGFSMKDIIKVITLYSDNFSIMIKFAHELRNKLNPKQSFVFSNKMEFKKNIHQILQDIESYKAFDFTEQEIDTLKEIFSTTTTNKDSLPQETSYEEIRNELSSANHTNLVVTEELSTSEYDPQWIAFWELFEDSPDSETNSELACEQSPRQSYNNERDHVYSLNLLVKTKDGTNFFDSLCDNVETAPASSASRASSESTYTPEFFNKTLGATQRKNNSGEHADGKETDKHQDKRLKKN